MSTVTSRAGWVLALVMSLLVVASLTGVVRGGPLDPPGPPGPTQPQIEPRIPIDHLPFDITGPGSYFLTQDLIAPTDTAGITLGNDANGVTIDLNGFALQGDTELFDGIAGPGSFHFITGLKVKNGAIRGWRNGIAADLANSPAYEDIVVSLNSASGIRAGARATIRHCRAENNGEHGIVLAGLNAGGAIVEGCTIYGNTQNGIEIAGSGEALVTGSESTGNSGAGIHIASAAHNVRLEGNNVSSNGNYGVFIESDANIAVRNSGSNNTPSNFSFAAGNVAPEQSGTTPDPLANINY